MIDYKAFFKDWEFPFSVKEADKGWVSLSFPLLYSDHDCLELYVRYDETKKIFTITDTGDTLGIHCCFDKKHIDLLQKIILSIGVSFLDEEIYATATKETFAVRLMEVVSAIIAVDTTAHALQSLDLSQVNEKE